MSTFFLRMQYGKEGKGNFIVEKSDQPGAQDGDKSCMMWWEEPFTCDLPPHITYSHGLSTRKILDRSELRDIV